MMRRTQPFTTMELTRMVFRLFLVTAVLLGGSRGFAQETSLTDAEKLHQQALQAARSGLFVKATRLWLKAYRLNHEPKYLYNLGVIAKESGKPIQALEHFERFLSEAPNRPPYVQLRKRARQKIQRLLREVATVEVDASQPGAKIFVDQLFLGSAPLHRTLRLSKGRHLVAATLAGYYGFTQTVRLAAGEHRRLRIRLVKIRPKVVVKRTRIKYLMPRWLPWTMLGLGAAIAVTSTAPFYYGKQKYEDYNRDPLIFPNGAKEGKNLYIAGGVVVSLGSLLAVAGVITAIINPHKTVSVSQDAGPVGDNRPSTKVHVFVVPKGVGLSLSF